MSKGKVLVTGGSGFLGSHLINKLLSEGFEVFVATRQCSNHNYLLNLNIKEIAVDWNNNQPIKNPLEVDYVIHCAGTTKALNYYEYTKGNILPTIKLLKEIDKQRHRIKQFIFISTQAAAGPSPFCYPINETHQPKPISDYGLSKLKAEIEVLKYKNRFPILILRPCSIYGPRDYEFLPLFRLIKNNISLIVGDGTNQVNMIYVSDFVDIIIKSIAKLSKPIYFATDGHIYNWSKIISTAQEVYGKKPITIKLPIFIPKVLGFINDYISKLNKKPSLLNSQKIREMIEKYWLCDPSMLFREINFKPKYTLKQGFENTLSWYKKENWL